MSENTPSESQSDQSQNKSRPRKPKSWLSWTLVLVIVTLIAMGQTITMDFVGWDDNIHVYENPFFQPVTWPHVWHFWQAPYEKLYVPISYTMFAGLALLATLPGPNATLTETSALLNPHVFHAANLLVHLVNTILVCTILRRLTGNTYASVIGSLIFAVHPIQVESVAWISEMRGLLSGFFSLLCLWNYLKNDGSKHYFAALLCALAALLCKPSSVAMPLALVALDHWSMRQSWRNSIRRALPFAAMGIPFVLISRIVQPVPDILHTPLWTRPLIAGDALLFYLVKIIVPWQFAIDYGRTPTSILAHLWGYLAWLVPLACGVIIWKYRHKAPWLVMSSVIFVAFLLPELGFVPFLFQTHSTVADRYAYIAMLGPAIIVAYLILRVRHNAILISAVLIAILTVITMVQTQHWSNSKRLFSHAIAVNPNSAISQYNYGKLMEKHGQIDAAIEHYQIALRNQPIYPDAHLALGTDFMQQGKLSDAIAEFQSAINIAPQSASAHYNLGTALGQANQGKAAIEEYKISLQLDPNNLLAYLNLGVELGMSGDAQGAITQFQEVLKRDPNNAAAQSDMQMAQSMLNAPQKPKQ